MSEHASNRAPAFAGDRFEWLSVLVLTALCLLLRLPALDRVALNPDESQYEATASYLLASGASPFSVPYGTASTFALYEGVAALFGPYAMMPMRALVLVICLTMSLLLFRMVRRETDVWSGLAAGLVFLHWQLFFEGHSANREWFAGILVLAGMYVFSLTDRAAVRGGRRLLWLAGLACGAALWFKLQVAPLVLPIPLLLLWEGVESRRWRGALERVLAYAGGGVTAVALHLLPFVLAGNLGLYLQSLTTRWTRYVVANVETQPVASTTSWVERFYTDLPSRGLLLAAAVFALICLVGMARRLLARDRPLPEVLGLRGARLWALYLVGAFFAVGMGQRYFDHYYLLLVPGAAALVGYCVHAARRALPCTTVARGIALFLVACIGVEQLATLSGAALGSLHSPRPRSIAVAIHLALVLGLLVFAARHPLRRAPGVLTALLWLQIALLSFQAQLAPVPRSLPHHSAGFTGLAARIESLREPGDRIFVWGWAPEIYSLTRLEAASHFTICQYIVNDYESHPGPPELDLDLAALLMDDLRARPPRFFVDASKRSWTMAANDDPWIYRLDLYPDFELNGYLADGYRPLGTVDGCGLYLRDESPS